jgi:UrcA family protein
MTSTATTLKNPQTRTAARIAPLTCAVLFVSAIASPMYAADSSDAIPSREVSFAGLNLTRPADVELLYRRIAAAASQVCDTVAGPIPLPARTRVQRCMTEAMARAVADVNAPALTRYYAMKTHQQEALVARAKAR